MCLYDEKYMIGFWKNMEYRVATYLITTSFRG